MTGPQLIAVTPEQAHQWLATVGPGHRPPALDIVDRYSRIMKSRHYTPEPYNPIRIDCTGRLREGRHRLAAVVARGTPVHLWVDVSAPVQAHERQPAWYVTGYPMYPADGLALYANAMRYDTDDVDDVRAWVAATSGAHVHVDTDGTLTLTTQYGGIPAAICTAYPGDWIAYSQRLGPYLSLPHSLFQQTFRKDDRVTNINYIFGDATAPQGDDNLKIITHVCNDIGLWGAGFVLAVTKRWPQPETVYRTESRSEHPTFALGHVQFVVVKPDITVANMIAQSGVGDHGGPPIRYDAVRECLAKVAAYATSQAIVGAYGQPGIHMPRIGCGLAGGDWADIEPIVVEELCAQGLQVTVYDWQG